MVEIIVAARSLSQGFASVKLERGKIDVPAVFGNEVGRVCRVFGTGKASLSFQLFHSFTLHSHSDTIHRISQRSTLRHLLHLSHLFMHQ